MSWALRGVAAGRWDVGVGQHCRHCPRPSSLRPSRCHRPGCTQQLRLDSSMAASLQRGRRVRAGVSPTHGAAPGSGLPGQSRCPVHAPADTPAQAAFLGPGPSAPGDRASSARPPGSPDPAPLGDGTHAQAGVLGHCCCCRRPQRGPCRRRLCGVKHRADHRGGDTGTQLPAVLWGWPPRMAQCQGPCCGVPRPRPARGSAR